MARRKIEGMFGLSLDWAIAKLEGKTKFGIKSVEMSPPRLILWANPEHTAEFVADYSRNMELAWPIILRERIMLLPDMQTRGCWQVSIGDTENDNGEATYTTSVITDALSLYVIHKNGATMDIPNEILDVDKENRSWFACL